MSGKRRISVDEAQWNVLQRQARQLDDLRVNAPKLVADVQRQTQSELARVSERLSGRQQAVERTVSALSEQTRALEADTSRRLREQASEMRQQLADTAGQLRAETSAALARQQQAWRSELAAERDRQRAELARLESEIRRTRRAAARAAETWLNDAGLVRDLIRDELPHERYAPGDLAAINRRLVTARATADQGNSEAALAGAQAAYHDLSDLRLEIELQDREWTAAHTVAYEALLRLDGLTAGNATQVIPAGQAGNRDAVDLDVDYWSEGALGELRSEASALLASVTDTAQPLSTEQLRDIADHEVPQMEERLSDVVQRARMRLFGSQLRANVAEVVAQTLDETAGYEVEDHLYEQLDQRRTLLARLQHANGNEIVVSVAPAAEEPGRCVLRLLNYDYDTAAEEDLDERARAVAAELRARGLNAEDQGCEEGEPDRALLDFDGIRHPAVPSVAVRAQPAAGA